MNTAREIYFKYFSSQKMACTKVTVCKHAMMGMPLVPSFHGKPGGKKSGKGKTPQIGIKRLDKIRPKAITKVAMRRRFKPGTKTPQIGIKRLDKVRPKAITKVAMRRRFRPGTKALCEICQFQKSTELLIPKLWFL